MKNYEERIAQCDKDMAAIQKEKNELLKEKEKSEHKWKHGDVFRAYDNTILICIKDLNNPIKVFGLQGCQDREYDIKANLEDGIFLFNIKEML